MTRELVNHLNFTEADLARRMAFFAIGPDDLQRLASLKPVANATIDAVVAQFYEHLMAYDETRSFLSDADMVRRLKTTQTRYFLSLFDGTIDLDYVENRLRIGSVHERIGVPPRWYLGAYSRYLRIVHEALQANVTDPEHIAKGYASLEKLMHFDVALAMDAYVAANVATVTRQQVSIQELSTPVIRVHHRVLLMPLVGTIDSYRAQNIMHSLLESVVSDQAKVLILDIAGVAVVDTQVADYLIKATSAVRLLGAQTILTGISPQVARTIVELRVDISAMHTRNRLSDGLELALDMVGRKIVSSK